MTYMQQILAGMTELNERLQTLKPEQRKLSDKLRQHTRNLQ